MEGARERRDAGIRRGLPFGIAVFAISISFGVLARPLMGLVAPIVMSIVVFSGSAQFGALAVLLAGGSTAAAIAAGVTSVIQPGGSKRDMEVVEAADAAGISMVFTHRRHFKH